MALGWAVLIIFGISLFFVSPAFRLIVIGIVVLCGIGIYMMIDADKRRAEEYRKSQALEASANAARWTRIKPAEVELRGLNLKKTYSYSGSQGYEASGSVKNNSNSTLSNLLLSVTAYDCPAQSAQTEGCDVIGRASPDLATDVPPGEVRAVQGSFQFANLPVPRGELRFVYDVASVKAKW